MWYAEFGHTSLWNGLAAKDYLRIEGASGNMSITGSLTLPADPVNPLEAATKQYVDNEILAAGVADPGNNPPLMDGIAAPGTAIPYSREDHVHPTDTSLLPLAGGTMIGDLILRGPPTTDLMAATKLYVDETASAATLLENWSQE
jgi:hypothetical protein